MVCLSFSLGEDETSMSCHRMLGKRAWLTLTGNKGSLHRSGKFGEWKKKAGKQRCFFYHPKSSDTHPSWDRL